MLDWESFIQVKAGRIKPFHWRPVALPWQRCRCLDGSFVDSHWLGSMTLGFSWDNTLPVDVKDVTFQMALLGVFFPSWFPCQGIF